jgi:ryanodine receptor 2
MAVDHLLGCAPWQRLGQSVESSVFPLGRFSKKAPKKENPVKNPESQAPMAIRVSKISRKDRVKPDHTGWRHPPRERTGVLRSQHMKRYVPKPLDTTSVQLPASLEGLLERLAENTHDVWAATRIDQGWTYGPARDDANKKHPCLVPYRKLLESEKEYDRRTAAETLKAILKLGYQITPPANGTRRLGRQSR